MFNRQGFSRRGFSNQVFNKLLPVLAVTLLPGVLSAQIEASHWNGEWLAEGTLFQVRVSVEDNEVKVSQVESLGFVWTSNAGELEDNIARIPVTYAGVNGIVEVELLDSETAVARAASCMPEFMVVCTLAAGREALFRKVSGN